jgi:putative tryptophan/tyrosine transport system substrate-binding protein
MKRREFISLLGGATVAWPLAAKAQQRDKAPIVAFLSPSTRQASDAWVTAFVQRLAELGWSEGRNTVVLNIRWADGDSKRFAEIATEFVRLKVDVIVTASNEAVRAAERATSTLPIIFAAAGDPVATGLVASLSRPGGNVTGVSNQFPDLAGKRLELLRDVVSGLRRLGILGDYGDRAATLDMNAVADLARSLGLEVVKSEIRPGEDIAPTFAALRGQAQALYIASAPLVESNRDRINALALAERLPTMHETREQVAAGGLMSYGPNRPHQYQRAAELVDKILRGTKPAEIPVEQPTKFELVINLKTAKALGLTIPESFLTRADEVIE